MAIPSPQRVLLDPVDRGRVARKGTVNLVNPHFMANPVSDVDRVLLRIFGVFCANLVGNFLFLLGERIACWQGNCKAQQCHLDQSERGNSLHGVPPRLKNRKINCGRKSIFRSGLPVKRPFPSWRPSAKLQSACPVARSGEDLSTAISDRNFDPPFAGVLCDATLQGCRIGAPCTFGFIQGRTAFST